MSETKFAAGAIVHYTPTVSQDRQSANGLYEVLRQMPTEDAGNSYRIKNQSSGQQRVAREHQLEKATDADLLAWANISLQRVRPERR